MNDYERVLSFWLGELDEHGCASPESRKRWWLKSKAFDEEIREAFLGDHGAILRGERDAWLEGARSRLAYVIVLDQFSRNMFRDDAAMYAGDALAQQACLDGIARGDHLELRADEAVFLLMPLMHSEELAHQDKAVALFTEHAERLRGTPAHEKVQANEKYAVAHRDIVAAWGRFPHRNAIVGRATTPEEAEFLKKPGSSF